MFSYFRPVFRTNLLTFIFLVVLHCFVVPFTRAQQIYAWGGNDYGQLGNGTYGFGSATPVLSSVSRPIVAVTGGFLYSMAITDAGQVYAWGENNYGQLGNGTYGFGSAVPVLAQVPGRAIAIAAGSDHSLALTDIGQVYSWGGRALGNGTNNYSLIPVLSQVPEPVVAIAASSNHSLAVSNTGQVYAWGDNSDGQLGNGTLTGSYLPVRAHIPGYVIAVAAGYYHGLALTDTGQVYAWGRNDQGQLGNGTFSNFIAVPVRSQVPGRIVAVAAGYSHSLALTDTGQVYAWGDSYYGQLGTGTYGFGSAVPVLAQVPGRAIAIAAGRYHSLAISDNRKVYAWGSDLTFDRSAIPVLSQVPHPTIAVAGGGLHSLAITLPPIIKDVLLSARAIPLPTTKSLIQPGYRINEFLLDFHLDADFHDANVFCRYHSITENGPRVFATGNLLSLIPIEYEIGQVKNRVILDILKPGTMPSDDRVPFQPYNPLGKANHCILNGPYDPNAYYLRWDSPGGFIIDMSRLDGTTRATLPLTYYVNLNALNVPFLPFAVDKAIRVAEDYIHIVLLDNPLFAVRNAPLTTELLIFPSAFIVIDPGQVDLRVTDAAGRATGVAADGTVVTNIPRSFYFPSADNPMVMMLDYTDGNYQASITGKTAGTFEVGAMVTKPAAVLSSSKSYSGTIAQGEILTYQTQVTSTQAGPVVTFIRGAAATVSGTIRLEGWGGTPQLVSFVFRPLTSGDTFSGTLTVDLGGSFTLTDVPRGQYTMSVKGAKWLQKNLTVNTSNGNVSNIALLLPAGDANDNNTVDISDLLRMIQVYNSTAGDNRWNSSADLNGDYAVDILDLLLLIRNYNRSGDN